MKIVATHRTQFITIIRVKAFKEVGRKKNIFVIFIDVLRHSNKKTEDKIKRLKR